MICLQELFNGGLFGNHTLNVRSPEEKAKVVATVGSYSRSSHAVMLFSEEFSSQKLSHCF